MLGRLCPAARWQIFGGASAFRGPGGRGTIFGAARRHAELQTRYARATSASCRHNQDDATRSACDVATSRCDDLVHEMDHLVFQQLGKNSRGFSAGLRIIITDVA